MNPLLEYSEWSAAQKKIGQDIEVDGQIGKVLSFDSERGVWKVRFNDGVRSISHYEWSEKDEDPGGPLGSTTLTQAMGATIAVESREISEDYTPNLITCNGCGWKWKPQDGGDDMFICHECGEDNEPKLDEEWALDGAEGTDWSFLPEVINSLLTPNFISTRPPVGNLTVEGEELEVDQIKSVQRQLTSEDLQFIKSAEKDLPFCFYKWLYLRGEKPTLKEVKKAGMSKDEKKSMKKTKKSIGRVRPYQKWPEIKNLTEIDQKTFSLPSGHTVAAYITAERLSEKYPHLREGLFSLANRISHSRVQGGVHYPSDIEAGKALAKGLLAK